MPLDGISLAELAGETGRRERGKIHVAVVGAGLGGTTLAAMLITAGYDVTVYEQAPALTALGAGIHLGPNAVKVMRALGLEQALLAIANLPDAWISRDAVTGEELFRAQFATDRYGAPYATVHRGKFHALLTGLVPQENYALDKRLVAVSETGSSLRLAFSDGSHAVADIVAGADGLNSKVRELLMGAERPAYTGIVCYRAAYPTAALGDLRLDDVAKWWGIGRSVMVYFLNGQRDTVYFVADVPEAEWRSERSFVDGDMNALRAAFEDCHPDLIRIVGAAPEATKWGMFERKPLPLWSRGRIVLLGDACHPMRPHMGQGAAMAMEDGAVLARCLLSNEPHDFASAFAQYEASRRERASAVQVESSLNRWLKAETDPIWVYGYDPIHEPLASARPRVGG